MEKAVRTGRSWWLALWVGALSALWAAPGCFYAYAGDDVAPAGDGALCGSLGAVCCRGVATSCGPGLMCVNDECITCGGAEQPCCPATGPRCGAGLGCSSTFGGPEDPGVCRACGGSGEACCADGQSACGDGLVCDGVRCAPCGQEAQPCCPQSSTDRPRCGAPLRCLTSLLGPGTCVRCGALGESCCDGNACTQGPQPLGCLPSATSLALTCAPCGENGQRCCPQGAACVAGQTCITTRDEALGGTAGRCVPQSCGALGEPCCGEHGTCGAGLACRDLQCVDAGAADAGAGDASLDGG